MFYFPFKIAVLLVVTTLACEAQTPRPNPFGWTTPLPLGNRKATPAAIKKVAPVPPVAPIVQSEKAERLAFQSAVRKLLLAGSFAELEKQAADYRQNKSRFANSMLKLRVFYGAFAEFPAQSSDGEWLAMIQAIENWGEQLKDSPTPRVALADAYRGYAWKARTSREARNVEEEGFRLMQERLGIGRASLEVAKSLPAKCPGYYSIALRIALGVQAPREECDALFEEAVKNAGDYDSIYGVRAHYLYPRWFGKKGEWEKYAIETMRRADVPDAREVFAKIALHLHDGKFFVEEFSGSEESWAALKESFTALEAHYPESLEVRTVFLRAAANAHDYQEARKQLKLGADRFDPGSWDSEQQFQNLMKWCAQPDAALEAEKQRFLRGEK